MAAQDAAKRRRWSARPWRARGLRLLVYLLPIAGSLAFVHVASSVVGAPTASLWVFLVWWLAISVLATGVVSVVYMLSRRLLPLGALLELSLVFPDEAPSRFQLALRTGTVESLEKRLQRRRQDNETLSTQEAAEILIQLAAALDDHDRITRGHAERVRAYSYALGKQLGLAPEELDRLNWAALLHDVGKLQVSREILNKPGRPTDEEWESLRRHPLYGETLVEPLREWLGDWTEAVGYHHERWDGKGYPRGVAGEGIPLAGRIVAITDVYDVITSTRSYKEAASASEAREELTRCSGTQFDPRLVRAFVNISLGRMRLVMGPLSWLSHAPLLARLPLTPSVGAAFGGLAALASVAATSIAGPQEAARAASVRTPPAAPPALVASRPQPAERERHAAAARLVTPVAPTPDPEPVEAPQAAAGGEQAQEAPAPAVSPPESEPETPPPAPEAPAEEPAASPPKAPSPAPAPAPSETPPPPAPLPVNHAPEFTAGPDQTVLEDAGPQSVAGWASAITPGSSDESSQNVSFAVNVDNTGLFKVQPAVAPDGTLTFKPATDASGTATVSVTAHDDGGTANGGTDTSVAHTFTITVEPVNDAPRFPAGPNQTVLEDAGPQTIAGWATDIVAGPFDESSQSVDFVVSVDNPALFAVQPAVAPDGTLTYKPAADANGSATVTVTAHDDGGTTNGGSDTSGAEAFTITVDPVNDAPTFTAGPDQTVVSLLGAQTVSGWATGIAPGPADESSQNVVFSVTVDNPGLFAVQPAVAPDGTLTYTPTLLAVGTTTVTVRAVDDGGGSNGGTDTSAPQTFTIVIL